MSLARHCLQNYAVHGSTCLYGSFAWPAYDGDCLLSIRCRAWL